MDSLKILHEEVIACGKCARLNKYCREIARTKRRAFIDQEYWGKPITGFGDESARIWIVGLAPAAHGANRTGRVFTGDRSGDFLFAALHRAALANQSTSKHVGDGLRITDTYISAAVRCAPPGNKPSPKEIAECSKYLDREWTLLKNVRVILALGKIGWDAAVALAKRNQCDFPDGKSAFGHGAQMRLSENRWLVGSYHVSQQNTFTGKLTPAMFDAVIARCVQIATS